MTETERQRAHELLYSCDDRAELCGRIAALEAENAKLREELEAEHALAEALGHFHEKAQAENAKLRELVRDLYDSIDSVYWEGEYATRARFEPLLRELGGGGMTKHINGQAGKQGVADLQRRIACLRKRIGELENCVKRRNDEVHELRVANAKLRELCKAAWRCVHSGLSCYDCRLIAGGCTLQSSMRELGVEVDG